MASLLQNAKQQWVDSNGRPLVGGKVYFYQPGTEVPKSTWQDQAQTILNTNPVVLDARGQAVVWGSGSYRQVVYDRNGLLIWDQVTTDLSDSVTQISTNLAAANGASLVGFLGDLPGAVASTLQIKSNDVINVEMYGVSQSSADNYSALQQLIDNVASIRKGGRLYFPRAGFYPTSPVSAKYGVVLCGDVAGATPGYLPSANIRRATLKAVAPGAILTLAQTCSGVMGLDFQGLGNTDGSVVDRGLAVASAAQRVSVDDCMFNGFGGEAIYSQGSYCYFSRLLAINSLLFRNRSARTGAVRIEGTDCFLDKFEFNTSLTGIYSSNLYLCGLYVGGANHWIYDGTGEQSEIGVFCSGAGTRITFVGTRADRNWGHGFAGQGHFVGCKAADNSQAGDGLYSGFTSLGLTGSLWQSCLASSIVSSRHAYGFDASSTEQVSLGQRPNGSGNRSFGHAIATLNNASTNPAIWDVPRGRMRQSGATPDMDGHTGHQSIDSGPVTITDFLNCVDGNEYYVTPNSNTTIQNNTNIVTGTGADLPPSGSKVYRFIYTNGRKYFYPS